MIRKEIGLSIVLLVVAFAGWANAVDSYYAGPDKGIWHKSANWYLTVPVADTVAYITSVEYDGSDIWVTKWATCYNYMADTAYHKVTVDGGDLVVNGELKLGGYGLEVMDRFSGEMYIQEGTVRVKGLQTSAYQPTSHATIDMIGPHAVLELENGIPNELLGDGKMDILDGMLVMPGEVTDIDVADKHWKTLAWGGAGTFVYNYNTPNHPGMTEITAVNNPAGPKGLVVVPASGLTLTEGGAATSYMIKLSYNPDPCTITVYINSGYHVTTSPSLVTFDKTNYNTPVTILATAVNDNIYEGSKTIYIKHELDANSGDPWYNVTPLNPLNETNVWVPMTVIDDAGDGGFLITESGGSTLVAEGGATDSFTVALRTAPPAGKTVTVSLEVSNIDDVNQVSIDKKTLTFNSTTWSAPQTVTVSAIDNTVVDRDRAFKIRLGSTIATSLWTSPYAALGGYVYGTVTDNECGGWGYDSTDLNSDCITDIFDIEILGTQWLSCTDPEGVDCGNWAGSEPTVIVPTSNQDAPVYGSNDGGLTYNWVELGFGIGWFGIYNGQQMGVVSILTLPEGVTSDRVVSATLEVPRPDIVYRSDDAGYPQDYNFDLVHIDATNDAVVQGSDLDAEHALDVIGVFRAAGPVVVNNTRIITIDVTAQVKADMDNERASFAFKTFTQPTEPPTTANYFYFPTVDNADPSFPLHGARLTIVTKPVWRPGRPLIFE